MKTIIAFALLLAAAALAGCAAPSPVAKQAQENFRGIQEGQSTREDVLRLLGKPEQQVVFSRMDEEVWDYRHSTTTWYMLLSVHFSTATGKVKYYTDQPDPAFHSNIFDGGSQ